MVLCFGSVGIWRFFACTVCAMMQVAVTCLLIYGERSFFTWNLKLSVVDVMTTMLNDGS